MCTYMPVIINLPTYLLIYLHTYLLTSRWYNYLFSIIILFTHALAYLTTYLYTMPSSLATGLASLIHPPNLLSTHHKHTMFISYKYLPYDISYLPYDKFSIIRMFMYVAHMFDNHIIDEYQISECLLQPSDSRLHK